MRRSTAHYCNLKKIVTNLAVNLLDMCLQLELDGALVDNLGRSFFCKLDQYILKR